MAQLGMVIAAALAVVPAMASTQTPATKPIRGAHYPALSPDGKQLCFEYLGDLWISSAEGGPSRRLTVHPAYDAYPQWSPDGRWIAFSSNREGNFDIFIIPARGGEARRMTWHSAEDVVQDWSPDGSKLLFISARDGRFAELYTLAIADGRVKRITHDRSSARNARYLPDGRTIAYTRGSQEWWRPAYRGTRNTDIFTVDSITGKTTRISNSDGFDSWPMVTPKRDLMWVSQVNGKSVIDAVGPDAKPQPVLTSTTGPIRFPTLSRNGSALIYESAFDLYLTPVDGTRVGASRKLQLVAGGDMTGIWKQTITATDGATDMNLSPDGTQIAFVYRGDIWTLPSAGGDAVRITKNPAADSEPAWWPDGSRLAFVSDREGSLDIYTVDLKSKVESRVTSAPSDEMNPEVAPDGKAMAYVKTGGEKPGLYVVPIDEKGVPQLPAQALVGPGAGNVNYEWSPDSRWLCFSRRDTTGTLDLWIVARVGGTPVNITRYPGINSSPKWTRDGREIVFLSSRGSTGSSQTLNLFALTLVPAPLREDGAGGGPSGRGPVDEPDDPQHPEAQRRRNPGTPGGATPPAGQQPGPGFGGGGVPPRASNVRIDFEGISERARQLTNSRDSIFTFGVSPDARTVIFGMTIGNQQDWYAVDLTSAATIRVSQGQPIGTPPQFAPDAGRFFFTSATGTFFALAKQAPAVTPVPFRAELTVDRRAEIAESFNQAWRTIRTQFYDPGMHGVDWVQLRGRYEPLLPEVASKEDFAYLLQSMIGELNASHMGATPPPGAPGTVTGNLGLRFDESFSGPGLRIAEVLKNGPADQTGRKLQVGQIVFAVDGVDVGPDESLPRALEGTIGRTIDVLVGDKPLKEGAVVVRLRPVARTAIDDLEYDTWVESRRRKVEALSGGRLAYLHIRGMDQPSLLKFQREIFGYAQSKQGLVLDVRFNGGGRIHDDLLDILIRKAHAYETPRDAERSTQPFQMWDRPSILLINEGSASDAEIFPNGFRQFGLGKLVGVATAGAVIGTVDISLVDGTRFRVPRTGWTSIDGKSLENAGVQPDIVVEQTPEDNANDNDKQLARAVKEMIDQLDHRSK